MNIIIWGFGYNRGWIVDHAMCMGFLKAVMNTGLPALYIKMSINNKIMTCSLVHAETENQCSDTPCTA